MKTAAFLSVLAVGVSSVTAAAVAAPDADAQFCPFYGQPCWKVKRTAEAFAEALASSGGPAATFGATSNLAARALDDLASVVASTQADPRSFFSDLQLANHFPAVEKRDASASADANPEADAQFCPFYGQPCWKVKRAAEAIVSTVNSLNTRDASPDADAQFCPFYGQPCWKRSEDGAVEARCYAPDGACTLATRDLNAMYNMARSVLDTLPQ